MGAPLSSTSIVLLTDNALRHNNAEVFYNDNGGQGSHLTSGNVSTEAISEIIKEVGKESLSRINRRYNGSKIAMNRHS